MRTTTWAGKSNAPRGLLKESRISAGKKANRKKGPCHYQIRYAQGFGHNETVRFIGNHTAIDRGFLFEATGTLIHRFIQAPRLKALRVGNSH